MFSLYQRDNVVYWKTKGKIRNDLQCIMHLRNSCCCNNHHASFLCFRTADSGENLLGPASIICSACNACYHCCICSNADRHESIHLMRCAVTAPSDPAANLLAYSADPLLFLPDANLIPLSISKFVHCPSCPFLMDSCAWASLLLPLDFQPHIGDPSL